MSDIKTGEPFAIVSQANRGLIAKDLLAAADNGKALEAFSTSELLEICKKAATFFMKSDLFIQIYL